MFLLEVKPWKSSKWVPPKGEDLITADKLRLSRGASRIHKRQEAGAASAEQRESVGHPGEGDLPHVPVVSGQQHQMGAGVRGDSFTRAQ